MLEKENLNRIIVELQELNVLTETLLVCQSVPQSLLTLIQTKAIRVADSVSNVLTQAPVDRAEEVSPVVPPVVQPSADPVVEPVEEVSIMAGQPVISGQSVSVGDLYVQADASPVFLNTTAETMNDIIAKRMTVDITKALTLNDRFRFLRELFGGNSALMDETLAHLNEIATVNEAKSYLFSRFNWDSESDETVSDFLQIIEKKSNQ